MANPKPTVEDITPLQDLWCSAYVGEARYNAQEAGRIVGSSVDYAKELPHKTHIKERIAQLQADTAKRLQVAENRVMRELLAVGFSDISEIIEVTPEGGLSVKAFEDLPRSVTSAIKKVKLRRANRGDGDFDEMLEIEMHAKQPALDRLFDYLGLDGKGAGSDAASAPTFTGLTLIGPEKDAAE